jgi:hypothetical protein
MRLTRSSTACRMSPGRFGVPGLRVCGPLWAGCLGATGPAPDVVPSQGPPALVAFELSCDRDAETWTLDVAVDAWARAARLTWTADGEWIEAHEAPSIDAAADGTSDRLFLTLSIDADWRDVEPGVSTAWSCHDDVGAVVQIVDLGGSVTDCAQWGVGPERLEDVAPCPP